MLKASQGTFKKKKKEKKVLSRLQPLEISSSERFLSWLCFKACTHRGTWAHTHKFSGALRVPPFVLQGGSFAAHPGQNCSASLCALKATYNNTNRSTLRALRTMHLEMPQILWGMEKYIYKKKTKQERICFPPWEINTNYLVIYISEVELVIF